MNKYWYVVQNESNKGRKEYLIGFCYGLSEAGEKGILEGVIEWCKGKSYRLALIIQTIPMLPIVNQIYPYEQTEETMMCLEYALQTIMQEEGTNYGLLL
ncbi:hypothetical protein K413DRAFT_0799 [Clostridium sp. ASBs410]|nr:hypothetical protein K413DRAFT_0799 [Clostridium sp. ASBs410]